MTTYEALVDGDARAGPACRRWCRSSRRSRSAAPPRASESRRRRSARTRARHADRDRRADRRRPRRSSARPDNEHADLFYGFPNSYGTLGYALRLVARTQPRPAVRRARAPPLCDRPSHSSRRCSRACTGGADFVDGVVFGPTSTVRQPSDASPYVGAAPATTRSSASTTGRSASARATTSACRLPLALGHRLVLVLEERRRAECRGCAGSTDASGWIAHVPEDHALEQPPGLHARLAACAALHPESVIQDVDIPFEHAAAFIASSSAKSACCRCGSARSRARRTPTASRSSLCARRECMSTSASGTSSARARRITRRPFQPDDRAEVAAARRHQDHFTRTASSREAFAAVYGGARVSGAQGAVRPARGAARPVRQVRPPSLSA